METHAVIEGVLDITLDRVEKGIEYYGSSDG